MSCAIQQVLRKQCDDSWKYAQAFGLNEPEEALQALIHGMISHQYSESALLVGASGTGKSMILNKVIKDQKAQMKDPSQLKVIQLTGLLHNEAKIACQEILDQFPSPNQRNEQIGSFDEAEEIIINRFQSQKHQIIFLLLEEFDLFATLQRGKQSFLYFLFDMLHHPKIKLGIFGITNRLDCISLLEKRVISRFSQIQIRFYPPDDFVQFLLFIQHRLLIQKKSIIKYKLDKEKVKKYNHSVQVSSYFYIFMEAIL